MRKVCVIGLGYIGLPTAIMFSRSGFDVLGVDINKKTVDTLNEGKIHIEEPGLDKMLKDSVYRGTFVADLKPDESDVFIIAVPTPNMNNKFKACDLSYVKSAVNSIKPFLKKNNTIVIESTISPRTVDDVIVPMIRELGFNIGEDIYIAHCPERVLPGKIIHEMIYNNRIVGGVTQECANRAAEIYSSFVKGEILKTDAKTAEMTKLMENTFRDVNIALANELTKVCNSLEINALDVIQMANKHPRVNILQPGPGVGGHCLAVDPYFIVEKAPELTKMISLSREINCSMPEYIVSNVKRLLSKIDNPKIAVFGITYKGNIDDVRESPALKIVEKLRKCGYRISIHDPHVKLRNIPLTSGEKAVEDADMILILTDHDEYKQLNINMLIRTMRNKIIFDTRNTVRQWQGYDLILKLKERFKDTFNEEKIIIKHMGNIH